ncbi:MAG: hypothetical protein V4556_12515 [Bacteroidota bacterium]
MTLRNFRFIILFSLSLFVYKHSFSQQTGDLIGDWKVTKVEMASTADPKEKQALVLVEPIFLKSIFHFKTDSLFSYDSPDEGFAVESANWHFDEKEKKVSVTRKISTGSPGILMGITVKKEEGNYLFLMEGTPLLLYVKKN